LAKGYFLAFIWTPFEVIFLFYRFAVSPGRVRQTPQDLPPPVRHSIRLANRRGPRPSPCKDCTYLCPPECLLRIFSFFLPVWKRLPPPNGVWRRSNWSAFAVRTLFWVGVLYAPPFPCVGPRFLSPNRLIGRVFFPPLSQVPLAPINIFFTHHWPCSRCSSF